MRAFKVSLDRLVPAALTALGAIIPKSRGKVAVHSLPDFEDGALAVVEALRQRGRRPVLLLERAESSSRVAALVGEGVLTVAKNSIRGRLHYLRSSTVITTHGVYRGHHPPPGQTVVNIWHGEPLTKAVGRWDDAGYVSASIATALSNVGKAFRCAEFGLDPANVLVIGAPRNDRMLSANRDDVRDSVVGGTSFAKVFLWLPTYRQGTWSGRVDGKSFTGPVPLEEGELHLLDDWLAERDALCLAKPHPLAPVPDPGDFSNIEVIDDEWMRHRGQTLYTLLAGVDCLISDVSSVWVDFLLCERPMIFHFPDLVAYRASREIHLEPYESWVPGPLTETLGPLLEEMGTVFAGEEANSHARELALRRFHRHRDAESTGRLLDALAL